MPPAGSVIEVEHWFDEYWDHDISGTGTLWTCEAVPITPHDSTCQIRLIAGSLRDE